MTLHRICAAVLISLVAAPAAAQTDDHGDTWDGATPITVNVDVAGDLEVDSDQDWFSIELLAGETYSLEVTLDTLSDSWLFLYDTDGSTQLDFDDDDGQGLGSLIEYTAAANGTYYVRVTGYLQLRAGTYTLRATRFVAPPDDHGDDAGSATPIAPDTSIPGQIGEGPDVDWFRVALTAGVNYAIIATPTTLTQTHLHVYDTDGTTPLDHDDASGLNPARVFFACTVAGDYHVEVTGTGTTSGGYYVIVESGATPPFQDVTESSGLQALYDPAGNDNGVAWGDANGDGRPDLYLGTYDNALGIFLFHNDGDGTFSDAAIPNDTALPMWWPGLFIDHDNDGDLDLYSAMAGGHLLQNNGATWSDATGVLQAFDWHTECSGWADFNNDGWLDFYRSGWEAAPGGPYFPDAIFIRNPAAGFNITWWQDVEGDWTSPPGDRRAGRGVTCADFDEDGDIDVYVSNYRLAPNYLWLNDGSGAFSDVAQTYGVAGVDEGGVGVYAWGHTIGSCWGDFDNDGHFDLFTGNFSHSPGYQDRPQFLRNLGPSGGWHFEIMARLDGAQWTESHASPALADYDNDGDLDVFIAAVSGAYTGQQSSLFRNDGNWQFTEVSADMGLDLATPDTNFQAAWADYDGDGDMDLFTGRKLFRNRLDNGNHWLMLDLDGEPAPGSGLTRTVNRQAVGAQVRLRLGDRILTRQVETATGWGNQNDPRLHFGLGDYNGPLLVEITWPDGELQGFYADMDQVLKVHYNPNGGMPNRAGPAWPRFYE